MSIERLSLLDTVTSSTNFAVNVNGQDYRILAQSLYDYIVNVNEEFGGGGGVIGGKTLQYFAPSATGYIKDYFSWFVPSVYAAPYYDYNAINSTGGGAYGDFRIPNSNDNVFMGQSNKNSTDHQHNNTNHLK